jgi:hypothetical protein
MDDQMKAFAKIRVSKFMILAVVLAVNFMPKRSKFTRQHSTRQLRLVANRRVLGDTLLHHRTRRTDEGGR